MDFITIGMMFVGFVANAFYLKGVFGTKIDKAEQAITDIQNKVVYTATCDKAYEAITHDIERIENTIIGRLNN